MRILLALKFFPGWPRRETPLAKRSPEREAFGTRVLVFAKRRRLGLGCWFSERNPMNELLELYITFVQIGCVNFGGGYAMLPLLERELVDKRHWTTMDDLRDYFSIGQCTPGIIALNVSTFIGEKKAGVAGALCATSGFLTGPIIIILVIASFLSNFADLPVVQHAFAGIRVCVCVLILQAVMRLWKKSVVDAFTLILYLVIFSLNAFSSVLPVKVPAAVLVICAGVIGVLMSMRNRKAASGTGKEADK